jgi:transposase
MLYLGIDQHGKQLTVCLRDENGDVTLRRQVSTEPRRATAFFEQLRELSGGGFMAIVEVCGFNDWLLELLPQYGCRDTVLIQPDKRSTKKTDRRDANALCELLWLNRRRLRAGQRVQGMRRVLVPSVDDQQDRQLTAVRCRAGRRRTRTINQIKHILRRHNLGWSAPTKTFDTKRMRKWLQTLPLGEMDRLELDLLLKQWRLWDEEIEHLDRRIAVRYLSHEGAQILASCRGLGPYGALAVACRLGPVERFPAPRSLANYWGLTPGCRNSGEKTDRLGSITKEGSAMVRFILGQLVMHVLKRDGAMRAWYQRIRRRRGSKIARVAVMRRLATIFWHMLSHRESYAPGGPPRLRLRQMAQPKSECETPAMSPI